MARIRMVVVSVLLAVVLVSSVVSLHGQTPAVKKNDTFDLDKVARDCVKGASTFTTQQCTFFKQMAEAVRQVNQVNASGEMAKLPKASQRTMVALMDALLSALPLMKEK